MVVHIKFNLLNKVVATDL